MRTTKTITLPKSKSVVEVYDYITGGEKRQITDLLLSESYVETGSKEIKGTMPLSLLSKANDLAFTLLIKNIDGRNENITQMVGELQSKDYDYLVTEINKITNDEDFLAEGEI